MLWIIFSSCLYSALCNWQVSNLLCRNLISAYLCCVGWLEAHGMIASVKVGFL